MHGHLARWGAFLYGSTLTGVEFPSTLTRIEERAFFNQNLTQVDFPDALTSIGPSAFANNPLTAVEFPDALQEIGSEAFFNNRITDVTFGTSPESAQLRTIGASAFEGDWNFPDMGNQIEHLVFPATLESIGATAFAYNALRSATFTGSGATIASNAFSSQQRIWFRFGSTIVYLPWHGWHTLPIGGVAVNPFPASIDAPVTYYSRWSDSPDSWDVSVGLAPADSAPEHPVTGQSFAVNVTIDVTPDGYRGAGVPVEVWGRTADGPPVLLGEAVLGNDHTGTADIAFDAAGSWHIWADYPGDEDDGVPGAVSDELTIEVAAAQALVTAVVEPSVVLPGRFSIVEIEVAPAAPAGGVPTGTVTVALRETADGEEPRTVWESGPAELVDGVADITLPPLPLGEYDVVARYSGSAGFEAAESDPAIHRVARAPSEVTVTPDEGPFTVGTPVHWQVAVEFVLGPAGGAVDVRLASDDGSGEVLATGTLFGGTVELILEDLPVGVHELVAYYSGADMSEPATGPVVRTEVVPAETITELSVPEEQDGSTPITLSAVVQAQAAADTAPGWEPFAAEAEVEFLIDDELIGEPVTLVPAGASELASAYADATVFDLDPGEYEVLARYTGDDRTLASSATTVLVIVAEDRDDPPPGTPDPSDPAHGEGDDPAPGSSGSPETAVRAGDDTIPATGSDGTERLLVLALMLLVTGTIISARLVIRGRGTRGLP